LRAAVAGPSWRLSSGTAVVAGLANARLDCAPTTAYVMLGERCSGDCAFCAQARSSSAGAGQLSRVAWPAFEADGAAAAIARGCNDGTLRRVCFQVTTGPGHLNVTIDAVRSMRARTTAPICASVTVHSLDEIARLIEAGASRVTLAIDAACERVYLATKTGSWQRTDMLLSAAARAYPGQIGTHLIVGLGETEREMAQALQRYADQGLAVGLFAFTPIAGTRLESAAPPDLGVYRRLQAVRWLISSRLARADYLSYDEHSRVVGLGLSVERLLQVLSDPIDSPFRTSGCGDCNRPYYNERPGGALYNYPRPLSPAEARAEANALVRALERPGASRESR
jgi:biotin synthase-related radical SAM superfamily protein